MNFANKNYTGLCSVQNRAINRTLLNWSHRDQKATENQNSNHKFTMTGIIQNIKSI